MDFTSHQDQVKDADGLAGRDHGTKRKSSPEEAIAVQISP